MAGEIETETAGGGEENTLKFPATTVVGGVVSITAQTGYVLDTVPVGQGNEPVKLPLLSEPF